MQANILQRSAVALAVAGAFARRRSVALDHAVATPPMPRSCHRRSRRAARRTNGAAPVAALPDFSGLVEQYGPAVVNISVTSDDRD